MTPVCTSPPTITNRPMKNTSVGHSTSRSVSLTSRAGHQQHHARAEQGDDRRLQVQDGVQPEPDDDQGEHDQAADQQLGSVMARRSCSAITSATRSGW